MGCVSLTQRSLVLEAHSCQDGRLELRWLKHIGRIPCTAQASLDKCNVHLWADHWHTQTMKVSHERTLNIMSNLP